MNYSEMSPKEVRALISRGEIDFPTPGMCAGYAQANLVILPKELADDFLLFTQRNPKACPVLEVTRPGDRFIRQIADNADVTREIPKYRVYKRGKLKKELTEVSDLWTDDMVAFLIGCSFSFEDALLKAGIPIRHIEEGKNVPMYDTNIPCESAGPFHGNMVVSMRPIPIALISKAINVTAAMPRVHGAPIHIGAPEAIGIKRLDKPDYGDAVTINPGEIPVFWPCGVTPQNVLMKSKPEFAITHAPGHMFITDVLNEDLMNK
ncbi:MAG: putative hydro-lyase [Clostridia bacterium]|nr:putative hydro-lyase [Clostridia bacterium]